MKTLFLTLEVHPLESQWPLVEEVVLEVEEQVVKDHPHPHPLGFFQSGGQIFSFSPSPSPS
jgi:hypothetical protein